jgi:hypothetical protein
MINSQVIIVTYQVSSGYLATEASDLITTAGIRQKGAAGHVAGFAIRGHGVPEIIEVHPINFCTIDTLIALGREMPYIAGHLNMDLATAWATKLTGLSDQEKFKALGWGLRTWDHWYFNSLHWIFTPLHSVKTSELSCWPLD